MKSGRFISETAKIKCFGTRSASSLKYKKKSKWKIAVSSEPAVQNAGSSRVCDRCGNSQPLFPTPAPFPSLRGEGRGGGGQRVRSVCVCVGGGGADDQRRDFTPLCALHYTAWRRAAAEEQRDVTPFPCWWGGSLHQWSGRRQAANQLAWKGCSGWEEERQDVREGEKALSFSTKVEARTFTLHACYEMTIRCTFINR